MSRFVSGVVPKKVLGANQSPNDDAATQEYDEEVLRPLEVK